MNEFHTLEHWTVAAIYIIGGLLVGFVLEKIVLAKLKRLAKKTKWKGDIVIINSLRGMVIIWLLIAGIYGAILSVPMSPSLLIHLKKILMGNNGFGKNDGWFCEHLCPARRCSASFNLDFQKPIEIAGLPHRDYDNPTVPGYLHNPYTDRFGCGGACCRLGPATDARQSFFRAANHRRKTTAPRGLY
jgi:hypothetical protein